MKRSDLTPGPRYRVKAARVDAHLFEVKLVVAAPAAGQVVSLPVWIPGSYLVREFARHLQRLSARQGGVVVPVEQLNKAEWRVDCEAGRPMELTYEVYAFDTSVRAAYLDQQRGFFNGTSLLLRVHGQEARCHVLELVEPARSRRWQVACGLPAGRVNERGFGEYRAVDYDELVDSPVEYGGFWSQTFRVAGVVHRLVVAGATPAFDGDRLLRDTQRICEAQVRFWHDRRKPPFRNYLFLLNAVDDGYGGLEHRNSTALIAARKDLPRAGESRTSDGYVTLLGLISHEYFHTWNVKRLRPVEFTTYDYSRENYTQLLWFFEGFTSYYDDLFLRRAGLIDDATYLKLLAKTNNQVMQTPGRLVQSVAQASFDAWVKYYRQDENTPNATVSYYTKGALVALCLDLSLRAEGRGSLDDVMRELWSRCRGGPMAESDLLGALEAVGGRSYERELARWTQESTELPVGELLGRVGVSANEDPAPLAQRLGIRVAESGGTLTIKTVLRGGAAETAGMAAGDEWLAVEPVVGQVWRMARLDDLNVYVGRQERCRAWVSRDRRVFPLSVEIPKAGTVTRLVIQDAAKAHAWLDPRD
ncbi:M61 family metallopeptidase [Ramlibacter sp.]|uniref:M61 family metallopeptidase n=1 Tax=Ramlibacter sp. TaxID=1917967 RepID=UPI0035B1C88F